jgi:hypothetical protein
VLRTLFFGVVTRCRLLAQTAPIHKNLSRCR